MNKQYLGVMVDCSRNAVMTTQRLKEFILILEKMGYNMLQLYTEDTFEVEEEPYFGYLRGRFTKAELKEIDAFASAHGVELVPCIETLAHVDALFRWPEYKKIHDCRDIMLADEERTYALIEHIFATLSECFSSKLVNIGLDEAHMVGLGKYLDKHGYTERFDILSRHLNRVHTIAEKHGFQAMMWSDMFFYLASGGNYLVDQLEISEQVKNSIPSDMILVHWDYYSTIQKDYEHVFELHRAFHRDIWFAGGAWTWAGFAPLNRYSIKTMQAALPACREQGLKNVMITLWGDDGSECSKFAVLPSLFFAAEQYYGNTDEQKIKERFELLFGIPFDAFLLLDLANETGAQGAPQVNPCKYLLYADPFLGYTDSTLQPGESACYASYAKRLAEFADHPEYGYLFSTQQALCDVLSMKAELGIRLRKAYHSHDLCELRHCAQDMEALNEKYQAFYKVFRNQWMKDYKPNGFDIQDYRLGGLILRNHHCMEVLTQYLNGEIARIEELEEPLLDYAGNGSSFEHKHKYLNCFSQNISPNAL